LLILSVNLQELTFAKKSIPKKVLEQIWLNNLIELFKIETYNTINFLYVYSFSWELRLVESSQNTFYIINK